MDKEPRHRYKVVDDRGSIEFLWHKPKKPSGSDLRELWDFFLQQHPEMAGEEDIDDINLDEADQKTFNRVRDRQDLKKRPGGGAILGILKGVKPRPRYSFWRSGGRRKNGMLCPFCGGEESRIVFTKKIGSTVIRIRLCLNCLFPFRTQEMVHEKGGPNVPLDHLPSSVRPRA